MIAGELAEATDFSGVVAAPLMGALDAVHHDLGMIVQELQLNISPNTADQADSPTRKSSSIPHLIKLLGEADAQLDSRDLLYLLLAYFLPTDEAKDGSERLLARFGSIGSLISAPWQRVEAATGAESILPGVFKTIHAILINILREPIADRPIIGSAAQLHEYLKVTLGHCPVETLRILYLDTQNRLIKDELQDRGTIDHVPLYFREIVGRVIELGAKAIILVHNHPAGNSEPSKEDVNITKQMKSILEMMGVTLHDHLIVTRQNCVSFHQMGIL